MCLQAGPTERNGRRPARTLSLCLARTSEVERCSIVGRSLSTSSFATFRHGPAACDAAVRDRDTRAPDAVHGRPHRARTMLGVRRVRRAAAPRRRVGSRPRRAAEPLGACARRAARALARARDVDRAPTRRACSRDGGPLPRARALHAPAPRRAHSPRAPRPEEETSQRSWLGEAGRRLPEAPTWDWGPASEREAGVRRSGAKRSGVEPRGSGARFRIETGRGARPLAMRRTK